MIVAGIGCRRGVTRQDIEAVLGRTADAYGVAASDIAVLATEAEKAREPALVAAAAALGKPLAALTIEELTAASAFVITRSDTVMAAKGVPSIAEAAALAAAGGGARLLGPRIASRVATCALAVGDDPSGGGP